MKYLLAIVAVEFSLQANILVLILIFYANRSLVAGITGQDGSYLAELCKRHPEHHYRGMR